MSSSQGKVAFVTGCNGITGYAVVEHLVRQPESEWFVTTPPPSLRMMLRLRAGVAFLFII